MDGIYTEGFTKPEKGSLCKRAKAFFIKDKGIIYLYDHMHCTYYTALRVVYMYLLYGAI